MKRKKSWYKNPIKILLAFLTLPFIIAILLFTKSLFIVLSAPTIKDTDFEQLIYFFDSTKYKDYEKENYWEPYTVCSGLFCWGTYTFSPLFPHIFEPEWVLDACGDFLVEEKLNDSPYHGFSIERDRIYNVYWITDRCGDNNITYGPFKIETTQIPRINLEVDTNTRPYENSVDSPYENSDIHWDTSISDNTFVIKPHSIYHQRGKSPKITAYLEGSRIVVKDVYDEGNTDTIMSGNVYFQNLPPGEYEILYVSQVQGIDIEGSASVTNDILDYTTYIKK